MKPEALLTGMVAWTLVFAEAHAERRLVTIADTIEKTEIMGTEGMLGAVGAREDRPGERPLFSMSPDRQYFTTVIRRGNLATGLNEYWLLLFTMSEVREALREGAESMSKPPLELARFDVAETSFFMESRGIDKVRWSSDSRSLTFIGRDRAGIGQVYEVDIRTRRAEALTQVPPAHYILSYALAPTTGKILYGARVTPDPQQWAERATSGFFVADKLPTERAFFLTSHDPKPSAMFNIQYFIADRARQTIVPTGLSPESERATKEACVDPTGRWAAIANATWQVPNAWAAFPQFQSKEDPHLRVRKGFEFLEFEYDIIGVPSVLQYKRVDLDTGRVSPLVAAPAQPESNAECRWSADSRSVLLPGTYLPPAEVAAAEQSQAVFAQVELSTGRIEKVTPAPDRDRGPSQPRGLIVGGIRIHVQQDLNTPPQAIATDMRAHRSVRLMELNPAYAQLTFARAEAFAWKDRWGRPFDGILYRPPDYEPGDRGPAVLISDTCSPDVFDIDGGISAPHAAQVLAAHGMWVLVISPGPKRQILQHAMSVPRQDAEKERPRFETEGETPVFTMSVEGAIDALDARQLIDRARVGLAGISRQGMLTQYATTFSRYPIAAAVVADSIELTITNQTLNHGSAMFSDIWDSGQPPSESVRAIGAQFWGPEGIKTWMERSYLFHLQQARTPTLYFAQGPLPIPSHWDTYTILKAQGRAVEMFILPQAPHLLISPPQAMIAKRHEVDWFRFWLKDEEDADPAKAKLYERWRQLRTLQRRQ